MKVIIARFNGESRYRQEYSVPAVAGEWTVMDVLDYIATRLDSSIAYYRHSSCNQGICGRCVVRLNGKSCLACTQKVETPEILLEPAAGQPVRDLVVQP